MMHLTMQVSRDNPASVFLTSCSAGSTPERRAEPSLMAHIAVPTSDEGALGVQKQGARCWVDASNCPIFHDVFWGLMQVAAPVRPMRGDALRRGQLRKTATRTQFTERADTVQHIQHCRG